MPTAILAANNVTMLATIEAALDMGFCCPDDISIAGIDHLPWSSAIRPTLTTACQPIEDIGREALSLLLGKLEDEVPDDTIAKFVMLEPGLFIQNSCARVAEIAVPRETRAQLLLNGR